MPSTSHATLIRAPALGELGLDKHSYDLWLARHDQPVFRKRRADATGLPDLRPSCSSLFDRAYQVEGLRNQRQCLDLDVDGAGL